MTDYERGVEQASAIYKEVIRDYVAENAKLRKLVADTYQAFQRVIPDGHRLDLEQRMRELGIEEEQ